MLKENLSNYKLLENEILTYFDFEPHASFPPIVDLSDKNWQVIGEVKDGGIILFYEKDMVFKHKIHKPDGFTKLIYRGKDYTMISIEIGTYIKAVGYNHSVSHNYKCLAVLSNDKESKP
jgi:hypothetical protein